MCLGFARAALYATRVTCLGNPWCITAATAGTFLVCQRVVYLLKQTILTVSGMSQELIDMGPVEITAKIKAGDASTLRLIQSTGYTTDRLQAIFLERR